MSRPTGSPPDSLDRSLPARHQALGEGVRARRESLGLRQSELAALAGCSVRFVHTLETGKGTLRLDKVLDVLEVLGFDLQLTSGSGRVRTKNESGTPRGGRP